MVWGGGGGGGGGGVHKGWMDAQWVEVEGPQAGNGASSCAALRQAGRTALRCVEQRRCPAQQRRQHTSGGTPAACAACARRPGALGPGRFRSASDRSPQTQPAPGAGRQREQQGRGMRREGRVAGAAKQGLAGAVAGAAGMGPQGGTASICSCMRAAFHANIHQPAWVAVAAGATHPPTHPPTRSASCWIMSFTHTLKIPAATAEQSSSRATADGGCWGGGRGGGWRDGCRVVAPLDLARCRDHSRCCLHCCRYLAGDGKKRSCSHGIQPDT